MIPPCLTLSNMRYVSSLKWSNPGKGVVPSPTPRCSSYWKGSLLVALDYGRQLYFSYIFPQSSGNVTSQSDCLMSYPGDTLKGGLTFRLSRSRRFQQPLPADWGEYKMRKKTFLLNNVRNWQKCPKRIALLKSKIRLYSCMNKN